MTPKERAMIVLLFKKNPVLTSNSFAVMSVLGLAIEQVVEDSRDHKCLSEKEKRELSAEIFAEVQDIVDEINGKPKLLN